jgi:hypothetical protein
LAGTIDEPRGTPCKEAGKVDKHITVVAALHIGYGILSLLIGLAVWIGMVGIGFLSADPEAISVLSFIGTLIGLFLIMVSVPEIVGGIWLLKHRPWARILLMIMAVLELIRIPLGTALGVYTIWVLVQDDTKRILETAGDSTQRSS